MQLLFVCILALQSSAILLRSSMHYVTSSPCCAVIWVCYRGRVLSTTPRTSAGTWSV